MPNHYHLLIETRRKTLVKGMQLLNAEYTRHFNRRWKLCGQLFQGRYKATLVEGKAGYLLTVADYIHLNFARSFISKTMEELVANPETSVGCYVRGKFPEWMEWKKVMGSIGQRGVASETEEFAAQRELDRRLKKSKKTVKGLTVREKYRLALEIREKTCVSTRWLTQVLEMKSDNALRRGMSVTKKEINNK